jgi:hypothetical protein
MFAVITHATYTREYRKMKQLEEDNYNNVFKRKKLNAERHCEYREAHGNISADL